MKKSRVFAALLAIFGGVIGLHKFYLRDIGGGVFYLMFFFIFSRFPITALLGIIEGISLLSMTDEKFDRKYNKNVKERFQQRRTKTRTTQRQQRTERPVRGGRYEVKKQPSRQRSNPFKKTAYKKYKDFDLEEALADFQQALEIAPEDKEIHFYMSAIYSLLEKKEKSFYHFEKSVQYGLKQTNKIMEMDDFAYLRIQKEFDAFKNNGFRTIEKNSGNLNAPNEDLVLDDLLLSRLNKLKELRERGLLSENEFLLEKEKIIRR